jgi:hypothetical protein
MVEKARGAAAFSAEDRKSQQFADRGAAVFTHESVDPEWDACIAELKRFRSLEEDWDGEGSAAPRPELVDGAISLAQRLQRDGFGSPDRVVVSVNGTIYFEWYRPREYYELEVYSPEAAEGRRVATDSAQVVVSTRRRNM